MSWLFSRALVEASSAGTCLDGAPSAQLSVTPTPQAFLLRDKTTAAWRRFPSGMTCEPLTADRGEELLTSFRAAFHAKTSAQPGKEGASTANGQDSGVKWLGSLAKYDRDLRSWKTPQCWLFEDLERSLETWPKWGMTLDGAAYQQPTPSFLLAIRQRITAAKEFGSRLPTPRSQEPGRTSEGYGRGLAELVEGNEQIQKLPTPTTRDRAKDAPNRTGGASLGVVMRALATPTARDRKSGKASQSTMERNSRPLSEQIGGQLNPQWDEWLMGWPIGWTELSQLEMGKFQQWQRSHGDCLPMTNNVTVEQMT